MTLVVASEMQSTVVFFIIFADNSQFFKQLWTMGKSSNFYGHNNLKSRIFVK